MNIQSSPPEVWQVDVNGQIYEANLEELTKWIAEGSLLPLDKVRRGNLRWLEAGKIPLLYGFFNARDLGVAPPPPVLTTTNVAQPIENTPVQTENFVTQPAFAGNPFNQNLSESQTDNFSQQPFTQKFENFADLNSPFENPPPNACHFHAEKEPKFACSTCANMFCKDCTKSFGTVQICPLCGAMGKPVAGSQAPFEQNSAFGKTEDAIVSEEESSGANWFFWIAGLSVVNSLIFFSGVDWAFFAGLAITQIISGFFQALAEESELSALHYFGLIIEFVFAGLFVLFGFYARRGAKWAFLLGMILYGLDGLIYLVFGSFIAVAIHAFALYSLSKGLLANRD